MMASLTKNVVKCIAGKLGYVVMKRDSEDQHIINEECAGILQKCHNFTLTSQHRMYALYKAVEYVVNSGLQGDFIECGVWRGGSSMLIALTLLKMGQTHRKIYLYDTFEGMTEPTKDDISKKENAQEIWRKCQRENHNDWCFSAISDVRRNMLSTGYPENNIFLIKGKVEDTIPSTIPSNVALLRLDTDFYGSTKHEMIHLYPLLVQKGVLIIDDYGYWAGARKAVDEYFVSNNIHILLDRIDGTGRIGIKI
jgi:O-methyltransferase